MGVRDDQCWLELKSRRLCVPLVVGALPKEGGRNANRYPEGELNGRLARAYRSLAVAAQTGPARKETEGSALEGAHRRRSERSAQGNGNRSLLKASGARAVGLVGGLGVGNCTAGPEETSGGGIESHHGRATFLGHPRLVLEGNGSTSRCGIRSAGGVGLKESVDLGGPLRLFPV